MAEQIKYVSIEKLHGGNYQAWKRRMEIVLIGIECFGFIDQTEEPLPDDADYEMRKRYDRRRSTAFMTIAMNVSDEVLRLLRDIKDPRLAWDELRRAYEPSTRARRGLLLEF